MLIDSKTKKPIKLPRIHGNTKIRNILTGKKDRTMSQWKRQARESMRSLVEAFSKKSS
jgi:hypothetical protein